MAEKIKVKCFEEMGGLLMGSWDHSQLREAARQAQTFRDLGYYVEMNVKAGAVQFFIWG